ncbi:FMN reductase [Erysipelothrix larvae]|uniref:FMN reductase n=1 Tax=Erysipelothrix larvae TaxID=1514105 RepID=A0A0X8GYF6_9FIRM|nr:NADPH-dependent FMN reductase [Erysipelothrix larvae]AMC92726.1 FMN reductase [Erysipelothrix larvae]
MNIVALIGSVSGKKTKTALNTVMNCFDDVHTKTSLNIGEYALQFSDGRPIWEYNEDTQTLINTILACDILIVGTPTYQTSIPGALKNVFDLLPPNALKNKVVGIVALAGSSKHYLMVESQLKPILAYMGAFLVQKYVFIEDADFEDGIIANTNILHRIHQLCYDSMFMAKTYEHSKGAYNPTHTQTHTL